MRSESRASILAAVLLAAGCIGAADIDPIPPPTQAVGPGYFEPLALNVPGHSKIAGGLSGIAFGKMDGRMTDVYYLVDGEQGARQIARLDGMMIALAMQDNVIHVGLSDGRGTPPRFWRMDVSSGIQSVDPMRADDRTSSSILHSAATVMVGSVMYMFGGCCQQLAVNSYDTRSHEFRRVSTLPFGDTHVEKLSVAENGREVIVSFAGYGGRQGAVFGFDPLGSRWTSILPEVQRGFPHVVGEDVWLLHFAGATRITPDGAARRAGGTHIYEASSGNYRRIILDESMTWRGDLIVVGAEGGAFRWVPPTQAEWDEGRRVPQASIE